MVQVIETGDPRNKLADMLGMSLGQSIGTGLNTYFANRSLESVMQDKALENAPASKKWEAALSAVAPYGELGHNLLKERMEIDKLSREETRAKKMGKVIAKVQRGEELTPEEWEGVTPQEAAALQKAYTKKTSGPSKEELKQKELAEKQAHHENILDRIEELVPYSGSTLVPGKSFAGEPIDIGIGRIPLHPSATSARNEMDTLALDLEGIYRELATKGALPQKTFQTLLNRLPSSKLTEAENRGRIAAARREIKKHNINLSDESSSGMITMFAPDGGKLSVPKNEVEKYKKLGAKLR
jgi:hypothetical protein